MSTLSGGPNIITNGLVLYLDAANTRSYPGTGTVWSDLSGQDNNGTLTNGPTFNSGNGGSIVFDGTDDHVIVLNNGLGTFDLQTFSIDLWFRTNFNGNYDALWSYDHPTWTVPFYAQHIRVNTNLETPLNNLIFVGYNNSGTVDTQTTSVGTIQDNTWYNVVWTRTPTLSNIYINSILRSTKNVSSNITYYSQPAWLGKAVFTGGGMPFRGNFSITRFYNIELTQEQITTNFNATRSRFGI